MQSARGSFSSTRPLLEQEKDNDSATISFSSPSCLKEQLPQPHQKPTKDFEAAFAALSSSYGYSGQTPALPRKETCSAVSKKTQGLKLFRGSSKGDASK
ncbi:hypothetical protein HWV62_6251 [Athelia sp. TMB]|nr:hypothetical protein HWV62_6251 [Athelia sp. TMB]